jgi:hypothetical protein
LKPSEERSKFLSKVVDLLKAKSTDFVLIIFFFLAGFVIAYLPYLSQTMFPIGWDTRRYVLGLLLIQSNGLGSMIIAAPFRFAYFIPELIFDTIFRLNPFKAEIYFPLVLASSVSSLSYMLVKIAIGNTITAGLTGLLSLVWNGYTRLARDLHSNLLYLDILLAVGCLVPLYFREKGSSSRIFLGTMILLLLLLGLGDYPLTMILIAASIMLFIQSIAEGIKNHGFVVEIKSGLKIFWPFLVPIIIFLPFWLIDLRYISNSVQGVWNGNTGAFLAPRGLSSLALIDPRSTSFLPVDGWIGYGNTIEANWVSLVSIVLTSFAFVGVFYFVFRSLKEKDIIERRIFSFFAWLSIIIVLSALSASLLGLFLPSWRALNDIPLPLFSGLGIGWGITAFKGGRTQQVSRRLATVVLLTVILVLSLTLLPFQINYSLGGNTSGHFNENNLIEVMEVKSWLISHNSTKPWIIIDPITDTPDYVQLDLEVTQTYFGYSSTLAYYGNLTYLMNWSPTPTSDPSRMQYSLYYFNILNKTVKNRDFTVIAMNFLYPISNMSGLNGSEVGTCCYVLSFDAK